MTAILLILGALLTHMIARRVRFYTLPDFRCRVSVRLSWLLGSLGTYLSLFFLLPMLFFPVIQTLFPHSSSIQLFFGMQIVFALLCFFFSTSRLAQTARVFLAS
ncbi:MAG: hypothetical protein FJZ58_07160 [Chlamydiae bacterium]|nr:hypothetical protein [Chlamydiota bacterium]